MADAVDELSRSHALAFSFAAFAAGVLVAVHGGAATIATVGVVGIGVAFVAASACANAARQLTALAAVGYLAGACGAEFALARESQIPVAGLAERHVVVDVVAIDRPRPTSGGSRFERESSTCMSRRLR